MSVKYIGTWENDRTRYSYMPVMTLDDLEKWLKKENHTCPTVAAMLKQVREWKECDK